MRVIPADIQEAICRFAIGEQCDDPFVFVAMRVCKMWAHFVCSELYRQYTIKSYPKFNRFCNTIALEKPLLPYGSYIRCIDLTSVNKYGIDTRAHKLFKLCPNLTTIKLGHPTSVKADTIRLMAEHCKRLQTLEMGGIESFPFMLDCNFSQLENLRRVAFYATPLSQLSLHTLPQHLEHVHFERMESLTAKDVQLFLMYRRNTIRSLTIRDCRYLTANIASLIECLHKLKHLELCGEDITNESLEGLSMTPLVLERLSLSHTQITDQALQTLTAGCLKVQHLDVSHNRNLKNYRVKTSQQ